MRFGNLTVLEKAEGVQDRYYTWRCRCDCGSETIVSTKNLTSHRTTHCGCRTKELRNANARPKDRTGEKYGALTALRMLGKTGNGEFLWECECECGKHVTLPSKALHDRKAKDCGCGIGQRPRYKDISGNRKGRLTALHATENRDAKGSVMWLCRCDCGREIEMSESDFVFGKSVSCGCVREQNWKDCLVAEGLTFVDGTCVEWLANRKSRSDNSSGVRGVYKYREGSFSAFIGLQGKKYYLGRYPTLESAAAVRQEVEKQLHEGFVSCWLRWQDKASRDRQWAEENPFFFTVKMEQRTFRITSAVDEPIEFDF